MVEVVRKGHAYCGEDVVDWKGILKVLPENACSIELPNTKEIEARGAAGHAVRCLETAKACFAANDL